MPRPLFKVCPPDEVICLLRKHLNLKEITGNRMETVSIKASLDRILAEDVVSPLNLPGFTRSTMDGYALRAEDSFGASENLPSYFKIIGEVKMGEQPKFRVNSGEVVKISTGGMLPEGANAVIMWEYTSPVDNSTLELRRPVAPGENIIQEDEDLKKGETLLVAGHKLRPQDIGALAGIGKMEVKVFKKPRVAIISTGNEIVPPQVKPQRGEIRDINSYTLGAGVKMAQGIPLYGGIIKDEVNDLEGELRKFLEEDKAEIIIISGGSSLGTRDITVEVLGKLGEPGVLVHGVAVKPGKPTIVALVGNKPIFGLPGHPVSAMIIFNLLVRPLISWLQGGDYNEDFSPKIEAELVGNVASDPGKEDYVRVILYQENGKYYAKPILGKSGLISTLVRASGLIKIGTNVEGLKSGSKVMVELF